VSSVRALAEPVARPWLSAVTSHELDVNLLGAAKAPTPATPRRLPRRSNGGAGTARFHGRGPGGSAWSISTLT
jgi:hypothetical protein